MMLLMATCVSVREAKKLPSTGWVRSAAASNPALEDGTVKAGQAEEEPYDHRKAMINRHIQDSNQYAGTGKHTGDTVINVIREEGVPEDAYDDLDNLDSVSQPEVTEHDKKRKDSHHRRKSSHKHKKRRKSESKIPAERRESLPSPPPPPVHEDRPARLLNIFLPKPAKESPKQVDDMSEVSSSSVQDDQSSVSMHEIRRSRSSLGPEKQPEFNIGVRDADTAKTKEKAEERKEKKDQDKGGPQAWLERFKRKTSVAASEWSDDDINKPVVGRAKWTDVFTTGLCSCFLRKSAYAVPKGWREKKEGDGRNWNPMAEMVSSEQESYMDSQSVSAIRNDVSLSEVSSEVSVEPSEASDASVEPEDEGKEEGETNLKIVVKMSETEVGSDDDYSGTDIGSGENVSQFSLVDDVEDREVGSDIDVESSVV
ncbi:hypothetical protein ACOMHN_067372 [Nucella lapillus]